MANTRYAVVRIDNGIDNPHTGVVSNHRTEDAAKIARERANARLRKLPGYELSWHPYVVLDRKTGEKS